MQSCATCRFCKNMTMDTGICEPIFPFWMNVKHPIAEVKYTEGQKCPAYITK